MSGFVGWIAWVFGVAQAGSGPWVIGAGQASLYAGVESQRLTKLAIVAGGERDVLDVAQGISSFGVKGIGTVGITDRVEVEAQLPWWNVRANRDDDPLCVALGLEACETTRTIGLLTSRVKVLVLDEYFGAPLSLSIGGELRYGDFTADTRARITNAGEGSTDVGPVLALGRVGSFGGSSFVSTFVEGGWRYRFPTTRAYPGGAVGVQPAPLPEVWGQFEFLGGPSSRVIFGPSFSALHRPGLDFGELALDDPDRFAALGITSIRGGASVIVRNDSGLAFSATVLRVIAARNNPTDVLSVGLGLSFSGLSVVRRT